MAAFNTTHLIGVDVNKNYGSLTDPPQIGIALGTTCMASDGHEYIFVKSTGTIAASVVVVLTEPAMTVAAGAGAWTTVVASVNGDYMWVQKTAA